MVGVCVVVACGSNCKDCEVTGPGNCDTCLDGFSKNDDGNCIGKR